MRGGAARAVRGIGRIIAARKRRPRSHTIYRMTAHSQCFILSPATTRLIMHRESARGLHNMQNSFHYRPRANVIRRPERVHARRDSNNRSSLILYIASLRVRARLLLPHHFFLFFFPCSLVPPFFFPTSFPVSASRSSVCLFVLARF